MKISLIVAVGNNFEIGNEGKLLWRLPEDLKNFKEITMGHHIIMGRKTFESIGKALPGRTSIIISRQESYQMNGCYVEKSLKSALSLAKQRGDDEAMVVGGGEIYKEALPLVDCIYFSEVDYSGEADTFFPKLNKNEWISESKKTYLQTEKGPAWSFEILKRK